MMLPKWITENGKMKMTTKQRERVMRLHLDERHGITAKIARKSANVNSR